MINQKEQFKVESHFFHILCEKQITDKEQNFLKLKNDGEILI